MALTDTDKLRKQRERDLPQWVDTMEAEVVQLAEALKMSPPRELLDDPRTGLTMLDSLYEKEEVDATSSEDANWITSHLTAYVAVYLMKKYGGKWTVDADSRSGTYGRYVVALTPPAGGTEVLLDVSEEVTDFLREESGRSLLRFIMKLQGQVAR
ncbi:MAG: hypothetical protein WCA46_18520 [Actinocatenispora sp.]